MLFRVLPSSSLNPGFRPASLFCAEGPWERGDKDSWGVILIRLNLRDAAISERDVGPVQELPQLTSRERKSEERNVDVAHVGKSFQM